MELKLVENKWTDECDIMIIIGIAMLSLLADMALLSHENIQAKIEREILLTMSLLTFLFMLGEFSGTSGSYQ